MADYNPGDHKVDEVMKKLEKAKPEEREQILNAERAGSKRVTILEAYGIDPDQRVDAAGRVLYPWEVSPEDQVVPVVVEETEEEARVREAQAEADTQVDVEQGGETPVGTETAPA